MRLWQFRHERAEALSALECVSSGTIRKFEWILRQFKEETRRLSSAKSSFVTQKWRSATRNCELWNFETRSKEQDFAPHVNPIAGPLKIQDTCAASPHVALIDKSVHDTRQ